MVSTPLHYLTIGEASRLIRDRELSPVELTRAFLERIEALDSQLHAYITVTGEHALRQARTAEAAILQGDYRGPMHGIPIALKDLYGTRGIRTTAHSHILKDWVPDEDATTVSRLYEAGAVMLGKLSMYEFAWGDPHPNAPFPAARNPYNLEHLPGGSSSGSGTATAAGLCMGSLGSDTGGSIRYPASLCGLVGMKATYGRVSSYGVVPLSWSLDHCGPMTWTVEDNAYMLQAIAGYDPNDPTTSAAPVPDFASALRNDVKGLVLGIPREYFFDADYLHPEQLAAVEEAIKVLEGLGAKTKVIELPDMEPLNAAFSCVIMAEAYAYHENNIRTRGDEYGYIAPRIRTGAFYSAADYIQSQRIRRLTQREYAKVMTEVDAIVTPTWQGPATRFDEIVPGAPLTKGFTWIFNFNGMPALTVCCGFSSSGLPLGLQIAGRLFDESTILRAAHAYERSTPWHERRPAV